MNNKFVLLLCFSLFLLTSGCVETGQSKIPQPPYWSDSSNHFDATGLVSLCEKGKVVGDKIDYYISKNGEKRMRYDGMRIFPGEEEGVLTGYKHYTRERDVY